MQAPDSIPGWLFAPDSIIQDQPELAGRYVKNALSILFMPGATAAQRTRAIAMVKGRVVGGYPEERFEGLYYVKIPGPSTAQVILDAIDRLNELPYVAGATPVFAESAESELDAQPDTIDTSGLPEATGRERVGP